MRNSFRWIADRWRSFFRKRRLSMRNATDNQEEWHTHISPAGIFAAFVAFVLLIFVLVLTFVAYSPVLELLPGYRSEADKSRENIIRNIMRLVFKDMNSGRIRFLFGSTQKLGTGVNAQERAVAIHHLDIP